MEPSITLFCRGNNTHVEAVDAVDNQRLGRDLGRALRAYPQKDQNDFWEVVFQFM